MFPGEILDPLNADELRAQLRCAVIGKEIIALEQTSSTNDAILQLVATNPKEGLVLFAEHQTAGRGQRGNRWESAPGKGLWFSILLHPKIDIGESARLAEWAARTVANTISREFALPASVKLPNDILVASKKIAGVLVEMRAQQG